MSFFTNENGFFDDDQIELCQRGGRPSVIPFDDIVESGKWWFMPNTLRTKNAIRDDSRPNTPFRFSSQGYKFSFRKSTHPVTGEEGLMIKCVVYPDNM